MKKPVYKRLFAQAEDGEARAKFADAEWKALCEALDANGQLNEQRKRIIDRLVRERVEYEFLYPIVSEHGPIKVGPNGGDVFSGEWSALQKIKDQILKLEEALKLTVPKSDEAPKKPNTKAPAQKFLGRLGPN
ncbi:P27 family phage terminase small subunit [Shimia sp.]|uniref:P27 family phage terminase small subunit n=1 Tax=Shimia sp. TaxID=1954381 RepID=UPI003BAB3FF2